MSDSVTLWTVAFQASLSMGFSRQEYWSGLPFPSLRLYSPFNLSLYETKPFTAFCTVLCVKEIVMNVLISQINLVELRLKVVSHSQLFYLPYFTSAIFFQGFSPNIMLKIISKSALCISVHTDSREEVILGA